MKVQLDSFLDKHGDQHWLTDFTLAGLVPWRGYRNRVRFGHEMYCPDCHNGVHPYQIGSTAHLGIRHNPGQHGECSFEDAYNRVTPGMSDEHKRAVAHIVVATEQHDGWSALVEHRLDGAGVRADVYAKHTTGQQPWQAPIIWEVQMSAQNFQETAARTRERSEAQAAARTLWVTPNSRTVSRTVADPQPRHPVRGLICDGPGVRIVDRAYTQLEPELVPMQTTIRGAVKGLIRPSNRLALIDWWDDDTGDACHILIPEAAGSTIKPKPHRTPTRPGEVEATGCDRPPAVAPRWVPKAGPILEQRLPIELPGRAVSPLPRVSCPACGESMETHVLPIHYSLRHPDREYLA